MLSELYNTLLYQPLFNLLVWLYNVIPGHDIGVAIILLTAALRLALSPLSRKSLHAQKALQGLQPKIDALKKQYANDKQKLSQGMMALYQSEKINPFSSCLPLIIQLPFLIAVYHVFQRGLLSNNFDILYPFVASPGEINPYFLGFFNLAQPQWILALLAGAAQFWQAKMMMVRRPPQDTTGHVPRGAKDEDFAAIMNKQMLYLMPAMTVFIGLKLPGGLALYWLVTTGLMALQQFLIFRTPATPAPQTPTTPSVT